MMKKILSLLIITLFINCHTIAQKETTKKKSYPISKSNTIWKKELTSMQYYVLREAGTERPFTSPLNKNYLKGIYVCAACKTPLYKSDHKFDSGSGWPSFDSAIEKNIDYSYDYKIGYKRTELKCNTCGGHLGHLFNDGSKNTTGKRHCINGVALLFIPKKEQ